MLCKGVCSIKEQMGETVTAWSLETWRSLYPGRVNRTGEGSWQHFWTQPGKQSMGGPRWRLVLLNKIFNSAVRGSVKALCEGVKECDGQGRPRGCFNMANQPVGLWRAFLVSIVWLCDPTSQSSWTLYGRRLTPEVKQLRGGGGKEGRGRKEREDGEERNGGQESGYLRPLDSFSEGTEQISEDTRTNTSQGSKIILPCICLQNIYNNYELKKNESVWKKVQIRCAWSVKNFLIIFTLELPSF